ncbi:MAG: c-type cytochrome [Nitrospinae bacterium]|nr:c-type cytochrome [Nitrospinota bacterium]
MVEKKRSRSPGRRFFGPAPFWVLAVFCASSVWVRAGSAAESRKIEKMIDAAQPEEQRASSARERQKVLDEGKALFQRFCVHCHGPGGKGDGPASRYLYPRPRDLGLGIFKFHSTQPGALPTEEDIARTVKRGVPGSPMPAWGQALSGEQVRSVVEYVKTFSGRFGRETPGLKIEIGLEPPFDDLSVEKGRSLYRQLRCSQCHGEEGEKTGLLEGQSEDSWGQTAYVYDIRRPALYKGGSAGDEIYQTLAAGIDGSSMSAYDYLSDAERWRLAHYLQSRFQGEESPSDSAAPLTSYRTRELFDERPDNPVWDKIPSANIPLSPLRAGNRGAPAALTVQSVHDENRIAFRLQWEDPSPDRAKYGTSGFLDSAAIQFALERGNAFDAPFFGMGERGKPVNIWHWKADAGQEIAGPREGAASAEESPASPRLNPFSESPVEELNSSGFGTLSFQSLENQNVRGQGKWENGRWTAVFLRDLKTGWQSDVDFKADNRFLLAFAVWDGSGKNKNADKSVASWRTLVVE